VSSTQGATNSLPASATLTVSAPDVTLSKAFTPAIINPRHLDADDFGRQHRAKRRQPSALGLADTLPANVRIATLPDASTTCGSGTVSAAPGGSTIDLTAAALRQARRARSRSTSRARRSARTSIRFRPAT